MFGFRARDERGVRRGRKGGERGYATKLFPEKTVSTRSEARACYLRASFNYGAGSTNSSGACVIFSTTKRRGPSAPSHPDAIYEPFTGHPAYCVRRPSVLGVSSGLVLGSRRIENRHFLFFFCSTTDALPVYVRRGYYFDPGRVNRRRPVITTA